jgi:hypothetical protein
MATKYGIQVYEILDNGNLLNAVYTNNDLFDGKIYSIDNEIATKTYPDSKGIEGQYDSRFIEKNNNSVNHCILTITKYGAAYKFEWKTTDTTFEGIGMMTDITHIAVSYVEINTKVSV